MSGQRPLSRLGTSHVHSFTSVTPVTGPVLASLLTCPVAGPVNRTAGVLRRKRVTMGAVSPPVRRPEDPAKDAELLRRLRAGDRSAVDDLYERFRRPAFALARRILADDSLAEDVLQEVFLSVWRDPSAYDRARGSFSSWLLAVVHHKAVDSVRREESQRRDRKSVV